jgi:hypothetical protein
MLFFFRAAFCDIGAVVLFYRLNIYRYLLQFLAVFVPFGTGTWWQACDKNIWFDFANFSKFFVPFYRYFIAGCACFPIPVLVAYSVAASMRYTGAWWHVWQFVV